MTTRILLVEDDPALLAMLEAAIGFGGFQSHSVSTGAEALAALPAGGFDAVLLDLGLPDCDGGELLASVRAMSDLPIIVVSGRGSERDKIEALDRGADDYVAKPFLPGELLARIRAALRRAGRDAPARRSERDPLQLGAMRLDPLDLSANLGGETVLLNGSEYRILGLLADNVDGIVSRAQILDHLYDGSVSEDTNVVDVYISRIRAKLRRLPGGEDLLSTVRGQGWRLRMPG